MPHEDIYEIEELERALNIIDPQTRREATRTYAGDCVLFNAKLQEACGIVVANGRQVTKALRREGFSDFQSFLEAFSQVKRERDAAVRDIEKVMRWDDTSVFCQFCKKDEVCDLNHTDCDPEWCGPREGESNG